MSVTMEMGACEAEWSHLSVRLCENVVIEMEESEMVPLTGLVSCCLRCSHQSELSYQSDAGWIVFRLSPEVESRPVSHGISSVRTQLLPGPDMAQIIRAQHRLLVARFRDGCRVS